MRQLDDSHLYLALNRCASSCRWHNSVSFSTIRLRVDSGTTSSTHTLPTSSGSRSSVQTATEGFSTVNGLSGFAQTTAACQSRIRWNLLAGKELQARLRELPR